MTPQSIFPPANDHFQKIYHGDQTQTQSYDELISYEDVDSELTPFIKSVTENAVVLDVGAGTGRISRLALPYAVKIVSMDLNIPMLKIAQQHQAVANKNWHIAAGDTTQLPVKSGWADVAVSAWSVGHFNGWFTNWVELVDQAISEMARALRPNGTQILIETLGTGFAKPTPPTAGLAAYYDRLENVYGFTRQAIRMDFHFPDVETAVRLIGFFFGEELGNRMKNENTANLIEWTGIWTKSN